MISTCVHGDTHTHRLRKSRNLRRGEGLSAIQELNFSPGIKFWMDGSLKKNVTRFAVVSFASLAHSHVARSVSYEAFLFRFRRGPRSWKLRRRRRRVFGLPRVVISS